MYALASAEDYLVRLHGAKWEDYERLLEIRGERSVPRITYLEGRSISSPRRSITR